MRFKIFVCNEILDFVREILINDKISENILNSWVDFVYSRRYSIYMKDAADILFRFIDDQHFVDYNININKLKNITSVISSVVCEEGIKILDKAKKPIKETLDNNLKLSEKVTSIEKSLVNTI